MNSFRDPKYVERYEDVIFDLETALNTTVANNAHQKKDGYRFVVDNSGEVTPFDWYNARISLDFKVVLLANGGNIAVADHNGIVNGSYSFLKRDIKWNGKKVYDCNDANHAVNIKNLLDYSPAYANKTASNEFFSLIHPEMRKSGNLKLVVQMSWLKGEQLTIKVLPFEKHFWGSHLQ